MPCSLTIVNVQVSGLVKNTSFVQHPLSFAEFSRSGKFYAISHRRILFILPASCEKKNGIRQWPNEPVDRAQHAVPWHSPMAANVCIISLLSFFRTGSKCYRQEMYYVSNFSCSLARHVMMKIALKIITADTVECDTPSAIIYGTCGKIFRHLNRVVALMADVCGLFLCLVDKIIIIIIFMMSINV